MFLFVSFIIFYPFHVNSAQASNSTVSKELKSIKNYSKLGKTSKTKAIKIGDSVKAAKKTLGKPAFVDSYRDSVVIYSYKNADIMFQGKSTINGPKLTTNSKVFNISTKFTSKKITYKQIKDIFGKTKNTGYDSMPMQLFITYNVGKYELYFVTDSGKYNPNRKLNDSTVFTSYSVVKF